MNLGASAMFLPQLLLSSVHENDCELPCNNLTIKSLIGCDVRRRPSKAKSDQDPIIFYKILFYSCVIPWMANCYFHLGKNMLK